MLITQGPRLIKTPFQHMLPQPLQQREGKNKSNTGPLRLLQGGETCHFYLHFIVQAKNMATSFFKGAEKYVFTICLGGEPGYFFNSSKDYHSISS